MAIQNNNPGNLRPVGGKQGFQQFASVDEGLQAMRNDLMAKVGGTSKAMAANYGQDYQPTLRNLITTYAPPSENNTDNYINVVAQGSGLDPDQVLAPADVDKIMPHMVKMETGTEMPQAAAKANTISVTLPNGKVIDNVPAGTTKAQLAAKLQAAGIDFAPAQPEVPPQQPKLTDTIPQEGEKPGAIEDVTNTLAFKALPEAAAAATPLGMVLNGSNLVAEGTRYLGGKLYEANLLPNALGGDNPNHEPLPRFDNTSSIPTSSKIVGDISKAFTGGGLYEPKTIPGEYANTVGQFAMGGKFTGVPYSASIPAAVVSETAGQATKGTEYEGAARLAGALATPLLIAGGRAALSKSAPVATADEIKALSNAAYQKADDLGGQLSPQFTDKFVTEIQKATPQTAAGKLIAGETPITQLVERAKGLAGKPLSLAEAQEIDEHLGDVISSLFIKDAKQARKVMDVQTTFRNMIDDVDETSVVGGKGGFEALKEGRALWSQQAKLRDIEKIITRAEMTDNPATAIKTGFRTLAGNAKRLRGYDKETRAAIENAAKSGFISDGLRTLGSRLIPIGAAVSGGGLAGTVAAQAATMASRGAATKMQLNRALKVSDLIAGKNKAIVPSTPRIPYEQRLPLSAIIGQAVNIK